MDDSMIIDITPIVNTFFNLITFGIGLDFAWCGYWFLKTNEIEHLPRLLGYVIFKLFERANKKNKSKNELVKTMFSMKAASIYVLLSGIQLIVTSMITMLSQINMSLR
jgi:hypothetical protein